MVHAHITSWFLAIVLFFIAFALYKAGNQKGAKIVHMVLRLFYLLVILTGGMIVTMMGLHLLKAVVGIWVIGAMEQVLIKVAKQERATGGWIQLVISLVLVLYLGFSLPVGFDWF